jgi:hypothetical protein
MLLDMHIPDWNATFLSHDPAQVVAAQARPVPVGDGVPFAPGLCYWPVKHGRAHAAMGDRDWLAESRWRALKRAGARSRLLWYSTIRRFLSIPTGASSRGRRCPARAFHGDRYGQVCPNHPDYRRFVEAQ